MIITVNYLSRYMNMYFSIQYMILNYVRYIVRKSCPAEWNVRILTHTSLQGEMLERMYVG